MKSAISVSLTDKDNWIYYQTQWTVQGSVFGDICDFFGLCMKYLGKRRTDLQQIHREDVFGPSLGGVWMSRSKVKVTRDKTEINCCVITIDTAL